MSDTENDRPFPENAVVRYTGPDPAPEPDYFWWTQRPEEPANASDQPRPTPLLPMLGLIPPLFHTETPTTATEAHEQIPDNKRDILPIRATDSENPYIMAVSQGITSGDIWQILERNGISATGITNPEVLEDLSLTQIGIARPLNNIDAVELVPIENPAVIPVTMINRATGHVAVEVKKPMDRIEFVTAVTQLLGIPIELATAPPTFALTDSTYVDITLVQDHKVEIHLFPPEPPRAPEITETKLLASHIK